MPLKIGRAPKGKAKVFLLTLIFRRELLGFSRRVANRKIPVLLSPSWFRYGKYIHVSTPIWTSDHNFPNLHFHQKDKSSFLVVGGFNPLEKYARQVGSFPQGFGVKIPKIFEVLPTSFGGLRHYPLKWPHVKFTVYTISSVTFKFAASCCSTRRRVDLTVPGEWLGESTGPYRGWLNDTNPNFMHLFKGENPLKFTFAFFKLGYLMTPCRDKPVVAYELRGWEMIWKMNLLT